MNFRISAVQSPEAIATTALGPPVDDSALMVGIAFITPEGRPHEPALPLIGCFGCSVRFRLPDLVHATVAGVARIRFLELSTRAASISQHQAARGEDEDASQQPPAQTSFKQSARRGQAAPREQNWQGAAQHHPAGGEDHETAAAFFVGFSFHNVVLLSVDVAPKATAVASRMPGTRTAHSDTFSAIAGRLCPLGPMRRVDNSVDLGYET